MVGQIGGVAGLSKGEKEGKREAEKGSQVDIRCLSVNDGNILTNHHVQKQSFVILSAFTC